jgi:ssDNA-binding Zn-finger/Zn-ribbon topoisomerase 1
MLSGKIDQIKTYIHHGQWTFITMSRKSSTLDIVQFICPECDYSSIVKGGSETRMKMLIRLHNKKCTKVGGSQSAENELEQLAHRTKGLVPRGKYTLEEEGL